MAAATTSASISATLASRRRGDAMCQRNVAAACAKPRRAGPCRRPDAAGAGFRRRFEAACSSSSSSSSSSSPIDPDDVSAPAERDDYAAWKSSKDDETESFKRAARRDDDDFVVGAKPLDEKQLSQVMLQLLTNHSRGVPAAMLLDKVKKDMCLDGYKSVLVGIGRTRQWALAREVVEWVRAQGVEQGERGSEVLTSNWFVALIQRRVDEGEWDAAVEVFEYMRDFGGVPSGECVEMFARVTDHEGEMSEMTTSRCRAVGAWLASSDAGKALWHLSFGVPGMEAPRDVAPSKTIRIAMPSEEWDIDGDIDVLRDKLKDYLD